MELHASVRILPPEYGQEDVFVHKYFLPQDLRSRILPADIEGVSRCAYEIEGCDVWEGVIPENIPDCVIHYKKLGAVKRIDGATARRILLAEAAYRSDLYADLTPEEEQAACNLNAWLIGWEKDLVARLKQLGEQMERQVRSGDSWLTDYEIQVNLYFYLRDDDPFSDENMPDSWQDSTEYYPPEFCTIKHLISWPIVNTDSENYFGIGDNQDHCDFRNSGNRMRHCDTFHELYDHRHIPLKHMGRIGWICTEINVRHQNGITVDLSGKRPVAELDEPRIREKIILSDQAIVAG